MREFEKLTPKGMIQAKKIFKRHEILTEFFKTALGLEGKEIVATSKKPYFVFGLIFFLAATLSKCSRSPATLRFCRLASRKNLIRCVPQGVARGTHRHCAKFQKRIFRGALVEQSCRIEHIITQETTDRIVNLTRWLQANARGITPGTVI